MPQWGHPSCLKLPVASASILDQENPLEKGNGNLLQYSCLGNPIDRGAWQARSMESQRVGCDLANKQSQKQKLPSLSKHTHFMQNHNKNLIYFLNLN